MSVREARPHGNLQPVEKLKERLLRAAASLPGKGRTAHAEAFSSTGLDLGRYSRLLLDLDALPLRPARLAPPVLGVAEAPEKRNAETLSGTLREAWGSSPALLDELFEARTPLDHLVLAGWEEGAFVRAGGEDRPSVVTFAPCPGLVLEPAAIDVGDGAEATLVVHWPAGAAVDPSLHVSLLRGQLGRGSRLRVFLLAEDGPGHHLLSGFFRLGREASLDLFCLWAGSRWRVARFETALVEEGASFRETHLVHTSGKEHFDLDSRSLLAARRLKGDVAVKTVAGGRSRAVFTGNIRMEKEAALSEAVLSDHVLLLSPEAHADSVPGLEIETQEVKAAHAASVGQVDEEELFYLESRGLDPEAARRLIVMGFLRSLLDRAPLPWVPEIVDGVLEKKVGE